MTHRVLILGIDGYIGFPLAIHLLNKGYQVCGIDNLTRRRYVKQIGSDSLTPIDTFSTRDRILKQFPNFIDQVACINLKDFTLISRVLREYRPHTIVHLAQQPSAPWSMRSPHDSLRTQEDNVLGNLALLWAMYDNCPDAHLVKLGTMGEYGTPACDIPEGVVPEHCIHGDQHSLNCPMAGLLFPRQPGSFYHISKVQDTYNVEFACRNWGFRSTDIMQGVVFGVEVPGVNWLTRFDYDQYFGTAINRFCAQALIGYPLSVYGIGEQIRGFLPLKDSIQCLQIAIDNPPYGGEYRTFNQFENIYKLGDLAYMITQAAFNTGVNLNAEVENIPNPRSEDLVHYYNPVNSNLFNLGYKPTKDIHKEICNLLLALEPHKHRINKSVIAPTTTWR